MHTEKVKGITRRRSKYTKRYKYIQWDDIHSELRETLFQKESRLLKASFVTDLPILETSNAIMSFHIWRPQHRRQELGTRQGAAKGVTAGPEFKDDGVLEKRSQLEG